MNMNVRNWIYTLLSRKFWFGVGVGFFLSSLLFTQSVFAYVPSTGQEYTVASSTGSAANANCGWSSGTSLTLVFDGTIYPNLSTYMSGFMWARNSSGGEYYATLKDGINGPTLAVSTTTSFVGSNYLFNFPQHTRSSTTYEMTIVNASGPITLTTNTPAKPGVYIKTTNNTCTAGMTPAFYAFQATTSPATGGSTTTIPLYTPLMTSKLTNMNCSYTATSTTCIPQYASTTVEITPANILIFEILFLMAFVMGYWVVRKLT